MKKLFLMSIVAVAMLASCSGSDKKDQGANDEKAEQNDKKEALEEQDSLVVMEFVEAEVAPSGEVIELASVEQLDPQGKPVIIDFNATWCMPCKKFAPSFEALAKKMGDKATFVSVDIDKWQDVAREYGIESIPTVVIVKANGETVKNVGYMELVDFEEFVSGNL